WGGGVGGGGGSASSAARPSAGGGIGRLAGADFCTARPRGAAAAMGPAGGRLAGAGFGAAGGGAPSSASSRSPQPGHLMRLPAASSLTRSRFPQPQVTIMGQPFAWFSTGGSAGPGAAAPPPPPPPPPPPTPNH